MTIEDIVIDPAKLSLAYGRIQTLSLRGRDVIAVLLEQQEPMNVTRIIRAMRKKRLIEQPDVSMFLRSCRDVGLVSCEKQGKNVLYTANKELILRCINLSKNI
jgi:DNA-binding transcriptional ArsR family regulator